jgi:hypothetical protein
MTMRRFLIAAVCALALTACNPERPVRDHLTLDFADDRDPNQVRVIAATTFTISADPPRELSERLDAQREAIIAGRDEWGVRFAQASPANERVIFDRTRGALQHVEHSALISRDDLHKFFADLPVTVQLTRGESWSELSIYPASSSRATREQREHYERTLHFWAEGAAHYLASMREIYSYLDANPRRAQIMFAALIANDPDLILTEDERALVNTAGEAMSELQSRLDAIGENVYSLTEEADLVQQPLSTDVTVRVPGTILVSEGFERHERSVTITRPTLLEAVATLEGKWLEPDPLLLQLRHREGDKPIDIAVLAAEPRKAAPVVTALEIEQAVTKLLQPASSYRVRWAE